MKCARCGMEYEGDGCPRGCPAPAPAPSKKKKFLARYWWILLIAAVVGFALGFAFGEMVQSG